MSYNLYRRLRDILPDEPLLVGLITSESAAGYVIQLPDGAEIVARGDATVGQRVFVRAGLIEGPAPELPVVLLSV
jgi:hypothetical protein